MATRASTTPYVRGGMGEIGPFLLVFYRSTTGTSSDFLVFPVPPTDLEAKYGYEFSDFSLVGLGEAAVRGGDKLAELEFASFFPASYDPTLVDGFYLGGRGLKAPYEYEQLIHQLRWLGRPVQLIVGGTNINWTCDIRDFTVSHRGGEPGDIYFRLSLKKHRAIKIEKRPAGVAVLGYNPLPAPKRPPMGQDAPNVGRAYAQKEATSQQVFKAILLEKQLDGLGRGW